MPRIQSAPVHPHEECVAGLAGGIEVAGLPRGLVEVEERERGASHVGGIDGMPGVSGRLLVEPADETVLRLHAAAKGEVGEVLPDLGPVVPAVLPARRREERRRDEMAVPAQPRAESESVRKHGLVHPVRAARLTEDSAFQVPFHGLPHKRLGVFAAGRTHEVTVDGGESAFGAGLVRLGDAEEKVGVERLPSGIRTHELHVVPGEGRQRREHPALLRLHQEGQAMSAGPAHSMHAQTVRNVHEAARRGSLRSEPRQRRKIARLTRLQHVAVPFGVFEVEGHAPRPEQLHGQQLPGLGAD